MFLNLKQEELKKLKHVKWDPRHSKVTGNYPDFFIAGPQRSGTTWFATQIRRHPGIRMAWPKELYFFNRLDDSLSGASFHREIMRKKTSTLPRGFFKSMAKVTYFDYLSRTGLNAKQLEWYLSFFANSATNRLIDLFSRDFGRCTSSEKLVRGEATASYATLGESVIDDMVTLNPEMKVVLTLRHPIERAWSHARKDLPHDTLQAKERGEITERLKAFFLNDYQLKCSNYSMIIETWKQKLKPGHLLIVNYHEIEENPKKNLLKIWNLLAVDPNWMPKEELVQAKINARKGSVVPDIVRPLLEDTLREQVQWFERWALTSGT